MAFGLPDGRLHEPVAIHDMARRHHEHGLARCGSAQAESGIRTAIAYSHKTEDEIAAGMDWGAASASRFFSSGDYWPALPNIPRLYRVLGNTIILQWLMDNTETGVQPVKPLDAPAMLQSLGEIAREGQDVLADNEIDAAEARRMIRRVQALLAEGESLLAGLQANVERGR